MRYVGIDILLALVGITLGFLIGTYVKKDTSAILVLTAVIITMGLGGGVFVKVTSDSNLFIKCITWISPMRYGNEMLLRTMLFEKEIMSPLFDYLIGYSYGIPICAISLSAFHFATPRLQATQTRGEWMCAGILGQRAVHHTRL